MKVKDPYCPKCGGPITGLIETVYVRACVDADLEYAGESEVFWDTQSTLYDDDGCLIVQCASRHEWATLPKEPNDV